MDATTTVSSDDDSVDQQIARHYDERPYASEAFSYSSPAQIRAAARLYGISAPAPHRARVLEVGCAAGGNILPFALAYPEAEVIGVDLSPVQIEQGRQVLERLGVTNMTLQAMSLTDIGPEFGKFDYIIAHGVFSWVPPAVRDALVRLCQTHLTEDGVAYISYNTYPGWKAGDIVRDAITLHSHGAKTANERMESARAVVRMFQDGMAAANPLRGGMATVLNQLDTLPDYYLEHEYLEGFNAPCYLVEFADLAMRNGMSYLGDAYASLESAANYGQNVQLNLSLIAIGQPKLMRQQYLDFLVGQNFRRSLLVHQRRHEEILVQPDFSQATHLRAAAIFTKTEPPANGAVQPGMQWLYDTEGTLLSTDDTVILQVVDVLSQAWPRSVPIADLASRTGLPEAEVKKAWLRLAEWGRLLLVQDPTPYDDAELDAAPTLIPGAMALLDSNARTRVEHVALANLWHCTVRWRPNSMQAWVMQQIDGKRNVTALARLLCEAWQRGKVSGPNGESLVGQRNLDATAQRAVKALLETLRRLALRLC